MAEVIDCPRCGSPLYNTVKGAECRKCGYVVPLGEEDIWGELWTRKVTPEERDEWLYEVKAAGDALKERCQHHKEQSEERGKRVSTLRKSRDAFIESLAKVEKERDGFKNDAEEMSGKLRAIQTWYDSEKGYNIPGLEGLKEALEGS